MQDVRVQPQNVPYETPGDDMRASQVKADQIANMQDDAQRLVKRSLVENQDNEVKRSLLSNQDNEVNQHEQTKWELSRGYKLIHYCLLVCALTIIVILISLIPVSNDLVDTLDDMQEDLPAT